MERVGLFVGLVERLYCAIYFELLKTDNPDDLERYVCLGRRGLCLMRCSGLFLGDVAGYVSTGEWCYGVVGIKKAMLIGF